MKQYRIVFLDQVSDSAVGVVDTWTLVLDPATGSREVEHCRKSLIPQDGGARHVSVAAMSEGDCRAALADSTSEAALDRAIVVSELALRLGRPGAPLPEFGSLRPSP